MAEGAQPPPRASSEPGDDGWRVSLDDCYELVMRLAIEGGLGPAEAADVCLVTMLRMLDAGIDGSPLTRAGGEWLVRTAVEQCSVARRLWSWRRPRLVRVPADGAAVLA